jgi:4a-hydroxytetrahydrobiopterin dehydratase
MVSGKKGEPMSTLAQRRCIPCQAGAPPLAADAIRPLLDQLEGWEVARGHHLVKTFALADFAQALDLVNRIGAVAAEENHHPDLGLSWGRVEVRIWTHAVDGLTENDFILAAKCDAARQSLGES